MSEDTPSTPAPKKRTRKATPKAAPVAAPVLPWRAAGLLGGTLGLDTDTEVMCARLTYTPGGDEVWLIRPMVVTEHRMMRDVQTGSVHPWHAVTAYCGIDELIPNEADIRKAM